MRELLSRLSIGAILLAVCVTAATAFDPLPPLEMEAKHPAISRNVVNLIEELHYSRPKLDNSVSSAILDRYLDGLDGNRMYFTSADIADFNSVRYDLDDRARTGELEPVFDIFNRFRERTRQRVEYAMSLLGEEPDFTVEESFGFDRTDLPWPASEQEMQEVWRQRVKMDALNLLLAGKTWTEAAEMLAERYGRLYKRVAQLTAEEVFETFMNAVAYNADPHSSYLSPRRSEEYRIHMSLSYEGIGARLQEEDDYVKAVDILPGGPAYIDGRLKPEDRIVAVGQGEVGDMVDVIGWRVDDVAEMIRGPSGTTVRLQILPAGAAPGSPQKMISLVRAKVKDEARAASSSVAEIPLGGPTYKIGVITVPTFYQDFAARSRGDDAYASTSRDVMRLIEELEREGIDGLIMDLRQNGGGHLSEAIELSGLFIGGGPIVQVKETAGNVQVLDAPSPEAVYDGPLAVLVDRYSASASEIFAAAIQDYRRGVVIGQQTFGKGTVQNLFNLDRVMRGAGNGQLTLTIGKYYRVTGESTQHRGVVPDVELPSMWSTQSIGESTRETALPWDRIEPTQFDARATAASEVLQLEMGTGSDDPDLEYLLQETAAMVEASLQKTVSLSLEARKAELEKAEQEAVQRENARRRALGLEPLTSIEDWESAVEPLEDIVLRQAARVVAEIVALEEAPGRHRQLVTGAEAVAR